MLRPFAVVPLLLLLFAVPSVLASDSAVSDRPSPKSDGASPKVVELRSTVPVTPPQRPSVLPVLYGGFVGLQVLDLYTTARAMERGAQEANPLLGKPNHAGTWAVKAATTASTVYFVERLWKTNRVAAVLVMAGINGGYTAIAVHNLRQAK